MQQPRTRLRSVLRWVPAAVLAPALALSWGLLYSGGMRGVAGWLSLISVGQLLGLPVLLAVLVHAVRKRRLTRPMQIALGLALFALWPVLWSFGVLPITYPASRDAVTPSATVRLPANEPLRVVWGGDRVAVNRHAALPDQRWAYDLLIEPAMIGSTRLEDYGCYGKVVVAPATARVHMAVDGKPDQIPGKSSANFKDPLGNVVVLTLPTGTYLILAHLKPGSLLVHEGDQVMEGQPIGACGNSGNTSEPHIHIHHQRQDPRDRPVNFSEGLPLYFRDHDGAAMPEGGLKVVDGKPVPIGAVVRHLGAR